jgi:putative two-component system response regulator
MLVAENCPFRIVVAEDNHANAQLFRQVLVAQGHEVRVASDGIKALDLINDVPPDLILLDVDMPRLDGYEVCQRVKANPRTRLIPVVIITGEGAPDAKLRAWDCGADDFLSKPLQFIELVARCRSLLRVKRLIDELETAETVVFALARAIEAKSPYTQGHAERVTQYALALAEHTGVPEEMCRTLRKGAVLHDIGKIGLPDAILDKPGPLTDAEYEVVKGHSAAGARIVEPLRSLRETVPLIRWHHERLDGKGYPDGLAGAAIPKLVRILSVADVYDALSCRRPYRQAIPHDTCLEMLRVNADGGGLDRELVNCFCDFLTEEWLGAQEWQGQPPMRFPETELLIAGER